MTAQLSPQSLHLAVVYSQYDRETHEGALERLITLLEGLAGVHYTLLVVDNAKPGTWYHEVSPHLVHLGGDNSCREFSAFDRGLSFLRTQRKEIHVLGFVTDAYRAYGEEYLELVTGSTVRQCLDLNACIGWVDSFGAEVEALGYSYNAWIRTSLFFLPSALLSEVGPLTSAIDPTQLFGPDAGTPFRDSAPLSARLRDHLLAWLTTAETSVTREDPWHSRFDLTEETFGLFQSKTCAILREQLLSARFAQDKIPCYDFRLAAKLAQAGLLNSMLSPEQRAAWQWLGWREAQIDRVRQYGFDVFEAPQAMLHGHPNELLLSGWVVSEPPVEEVRLRVGDHWILGGRCDLPRPQEAADDGVELQGTKVGFEIRGALDGLEPGLYDVEWSVPGSSLTETLSSVHVLPRSEFKPRRVFVPERASAEHTFQISVEGWFESSHSLVQIEARWNGEAADLKASWAENSSYKNGLWTYDLVVFGEVALVENAPQHALTLVFHTADGAARTWRHFQVIRPGAPLPHLLAGRWIGSFDPQTKRVPVHLEGAVCGVTDDSRLLFSCDDEFLLSEELPAITRDVARFDIRCEVAKIPPGERDFALALQLGQQAPVEFARWSARVEYLRPRLDVDLCKVQPVQRSSPPLHVVELSGWVENHTLVGDLVLTANDQQVTEVAFNRFRPDLAKAWGYPLVRKQGFATALAVELEPGRNVLKLCYGQAGREEVLWQETVEIGQQQLEDFMIHAPVLLDLEEGSPSTFWSSIAISGTMESPLDGVAGTLYVNGEQVDQQPILSAGSFALRHVPERSGAYTVQVLFKTPERSLYDSGTVEVQFEKIAVPPEACKLLDRFLETFEIRRRLDLGTSQQVTRALLERNLETISDQFLMLREIDQALATSSQKAALNIVAPPQERLATTDLGPRSLRVLFVSWNVPCSRHGGGVWMLNLLKHLGQRHEITVIYCYSPYEEGWIDDVRPYVHRTIGVPRRTQATVAHEYNPLFRDFYAEYVAELRTAIELELWNGAYDLVDYQYVQMLPYLSKADIPQVLTVFEERFSAELEQDLSDTPTELEKMELVDRLLKAFYLSAIAIPRALKHVVAVTAQDARAMVDFQTNMEVHINSIGMDMASFRRPSGVEEGGSGAGQDLVVLGNYHHPPSAHAALFCAEKVLPSLQQTHPEAGLAIVGAFPTPELEELAAEPGIVVTGFVADHRPYLWGAAAFVAPIFTGSGMRVKVLEAMASGVPVIATGLAMHGIGALPGEHYFRAETVEDFVAAARQCLEAPEKAHAIGRQGRELIAEKHSNEQRAGEREAIWFQVINCFEGRSNQPCE